MCLCPRVSLRLSVCTIRWPCRHLDDLYHPLTMSVCISSGWCFWWTWSLSHSLCIWLIEIYIDLLFYCIPPPSVQHCLIANIEATHVTRLFVCVHVCVCVSLYVCLHVLGEKSQESQRIVSSKLCRNCKHFFSSFFARLSELVSECKMMLCDLSATNLTKVITITAATATLCHYRHQGSIVQRTPKFAKRLSRSPNRRINLHILSQNEKK